MTTEVEEERVPIPISCYSLVVVRKVVVEEGGNSVVKFLAVQETPKHGSTWYLPAGTTLKHL
jgi:hypothetical protein